MGSMMSNVSGQSYPNQQKKDIASAERNLPEIQMYVYGLNTASQPYLLNQHTPYLLNMKFDSTGQTLYRRDGHKVYKSFATGEKIISAMQSLSGAIYYITKLGSTVTLRSLARKESQTVEKEIDISSLVTMADGDKIDNFDIITGFESGGFNVFPYFNIKDSSGNFKKNINLKTDMNLSQIGNNDIISVTGATPTTNLHIISHSNYQNILFLLIKDGDNFKLAWGSEGSVSLVHSLIIPNDEEVYALKAFGDSVYAYCEDRIYRIRYDETKKEARLEVHSEGYGTTSNKLIKGIGTSIFYYGESSGLAVMTGSNSNSIADVTQLQRPIDNAVSNFHKVFKAVNTCYKKDDGSLYIIGNIDCDYIFEAIHWQNVYCQSQTGMTEAEYENSLSSFTASLAGKNQFILEYNISLARFSLHFYDKEILGHFNMRLRIAGLEYDQSSELIFTEDYIATTHSDFTNDNGVEFPVQINTIPRNKGLFKAFISCVYKVNIMFTSNSVPIPDKKVYITNGDMNFSITNKKIELRYEDTTEHFTTENITNVLTVSDTVSSILPSHLIGFYSDNILIFDGVNVVHNTVSMKNM